MYTPTWGLARGLTWTNAQQLRDTQTEALRGRDLARGHQPSIRGCTPASPDPSPPPPPLERDPSRDSVRLACLVEEASEVQRAWEETGV